MRSTFRVGAIGLSMSLLVGGGLESQGPELVQSSPADAAHVAALARAVEEDLPYVPGELLVRFKPGTTQQQSESALTVLRSTITPDNAAWIGPLLHLRALDIDDPVRAAATLARQPEVQYAHPNYLTPLHSVPNDSGYSQQWNMNLINMPQAWDISRGAGSGITVAVIDTGLTTRDGTFGFNVWSPVATAFQAVAIPFARAEDLDHSRVQGAVDLQTFGRWTVGGQPLVFDADGHGSHVAGTIAQQTNNGSGYAGAANGVTIMPIKACFSRWDLQLYRNHVEGVPGFAPAGPTLCETAAWISGIRHAADNGAKIINLSLGGLFPQASALDALNYAVSRGAFVSISAGNDGREGNPISYPAFYASQIDGVMAVAAVGPSRDRAVFSTSGSYVEIAAPGGAGSGSPSSEQVWQIAPNRVDLINAPARLAPAFNRSQNLGISGTSMASPHVAALAALLYAQGITRPASIEAAIRRFAVDRGPAGKDDEYGYGLIDARATLRGLGVTR
jgi:serine protease